MHLSLEKKHFTLYIIALLFAVCLSAQTQKTVTIGWYPLAGFQESASDGSHSGYIYEFLQHISDFTGWQYEYIETSRDKCLTLLAQGQIDMVCGLDDSPDTATKCNICPVSAGTAFFMLIARKDDSRFSFDDYQAVNGMTIATESGEKYITEKFAELEKQHHFSANLSIYPSSDAAIKALIHNSSDIALVSSLVDTSDFKIIAQFNPHQFYIGTTRDRPALARSLANAMLEITTETPDYTQLLTQQYFDRSTKGTVSLTQQEKKFIASSPEITVYTPQSLPVLGYMKDGEFSGYFRNILDIISENTGLRFHYVPIQNYTKSIELTWATRNSVNCYIINDYKWGEANGLKLTSPVLNYPLAFIYRKTLDHSIYTLAYYDTGFLPSSLLSSVSYRIQKYDSQANALEAVIGGKADAYITNIYTAQDLLQKRKYKTLAVSTESILSFRTGFALSRSSDSDLYSIFNKSIRNISQRELNNVLHKSLSDSYHYNITDFLLDNILIIAFVIIFIIILIIMNLALSHNEQKLSEANKSKDSFLANMSHDFRTPLNAIKGLAYLGSTEKNPAYYKQIITSSDYLLALVKDILNIQQYAKGDLLELYPSAAFINDIKEEVLLVIQDRALTKRISIQTDFNVPYPYLLIDVMRIKQLFINLLNNAVKYSRQDSTVIWKLEEHSSEGNIYLVSSVIDHGVGMSREFVETKLFHAFEREHNQLSTSEGGTGLGLAISKMVAERMAGTITVSSQLGTGTTFTVHIPVDTLTEDKYNELKNATKPEVTNIDFTGKRILICEDNELNTFLEKNILEKRGCIVETAADGEQGVSRFVSSKVGYFNAILMDVRMPVLDGLEATKKIRALDRPDAAVIPIIALSANAFAEDKAKSLQSGMNDHISKPIDVDILFSTLAKLL